MSAEWVVVRDGEVVEVCETEGGAWRALHRLQPHSIAHATGYEGWSIEHRSETASA